MINGLLQLLVFQALGELVSRFLIPFIPGPVIGLVLLLIFLGWLGSVPQKIDLVGGTILQHLGLLFIPPSAYRDWETDRKSTRLNSSHRL